MPSDLLLIWQICSAMSANDLINFWDQTISNFEFCNIYQTQEMRNDWTMNIKQNVMSHTRITHDKFHTKKIQNGCQSAIFYYFFLIIRKSCIIADL